MSEDLRTRTRVAQRYQVEELVRRRPYANVYNASRDDDPNARFTVWQLRGIFSVTAPTVERFADGLAAVRVISNGSIARIVGHQVIADGPVVVTETVRGPTLRERLLRSHRLPQSDVICVVRGVASVLDELHGRDPPLLHRALSPDEIHIDGDRCVVQACGFVHAMTTSGMLRGTHTGFAEPSYRVPEALAETLDPRADLFALASVVFECLTGERAFAGDDPMTVANAMRRDRRPSVVVLRPEVPAGVDEILARAWSVETRDAYPTAWSFARDLTSALEGMSPARTTPTPKTARTFDTPKPTDTGPMLVMSEPSVVMAHPEFEFSNPSLVEEPPTVASAEPLNAQRPSSLPPASEGETVPLRRASLYPSRTPVDNQPLFAERSPRGPIPFSVTSSEPTTPAPRTPTQPRPNIPFASSPAAPSRTPSIPAPSWGMGVPDALPHDEPHDEPETREYDDRLGQPQDSQPDTQVYPGNLVAKVDRMHRAGASRLVRQESDPSAPPVGRAPPPPTDSVRSVMRAETVQPPTGHRVEPAPRPARPSRPPQGFSHASADAPPIGVVPVAARPVVTPGYVPSAPYPQATVNAALRANTVPGVGVGTPLRGPSQPPLQNPLRGISTPSMNSPLRAPSGAQVVIAQAADRPPVGVVPGAQPTGHRARVQTVPGRRPEAPPAAPHPSPREVPLLTAESASAPQGGAGLVVVSAPQSPVVAPPSERVPTAFPNINRPPVKLLSPTPPPLVVPNAHTLFGLHRSAVVLGGSIVLAALIFTVGQVYVAQQPTTRVEAVERSHVRAEPTDATRLALSSAVEQCVPRPYPTGVTSVRFNATYEGASGRCTAVRVDPTFGALPLARCIERAARASSVPAFASTIDSVDYVIPLY